MEGTMTPQNPEIPPRESWPSCLTEWITALSAARARIAELEDYIEIMKRTHGQTFAAMRSEADSLTARAKVMQDQRDLRLGQLRAKESECEALRQQNAELAAALDVLYHDCPSFPGYAKRILAVRDAALVEPLAALQDAVAASYALVASRGYVNISLPVEIWESCREASEKQKGNAASHDERKALAAHAKEPTGTKMIVPGIELSWTPANGQRTTAIFPNRHRLLANGCGRFTAANDRGDVDRWDLYRQTSGTVEITFAEFDMPCPKLEAKP